MDRSEGAVTATEVLIEAIENVDQRGISRIIVLAFDIHGNPVGWLSNIAEYTQRIGLLEIGKQAMISDKE